VLEGVDPIGLLHGPMIHPHDHVLRMFACRTDRNRLTIRVNDDQGTSGVKTETSDRFGTDVRLLHGAADHLTALFPDVVRRLFDEVGLRLPHLNRTRGGAEHATGRIEHARANAPGTDVNTNKERFRGVR